MATFIFVPGAWHTEYHFQPMLPYLSRPSIVVTLPTTLDPIGKTFEDNVATVVKVLRETENPILVSHSASGYVCEAALTELGYRVESIMIAAFFNGPRAFENNIFFDINYETLEATLTIPPPRDVFYNDMSDEDAKPFVDALQKHRLYSWEPTGDERKMTTYVVCLKDKAVFADRQRLEAQDLGVPAVEFDGDHCPFASRPKEFAAFIEGLVKG